MFWALSRHTLCVGAELSADIITLIRRRVGQNWDADVKDDLSGGLYDVVEG